MRDTWEIIFAGVGGQGLVSCGNMLGEAASFQGLNAVMTTSYGVETRGTFAKSDLIVSTQPIDFPECLYPDVVLCLADVAYQRYAPSVSADTLLIYDRDAVTPGWSQAKQCAFPICATAEALGNPASANILALGIILGKTKMLPTRAMIHAIEKRFSRNPKAVENNKTIFLKGMELAGQ